MRLNESYERPEQNRLVHKAIRFKPGSKENQLREGHEGGQASSFNRCLIPYLPSCLRGWSPSLVRQVHQIRQELISAAQYSNVTMFDALPVASIT